MLDEEIKMLRWSGASKSSLFLFIQKKLLIVTKMIVFFN